MSPPGRRAARDRQIDPGARPGRAGRLRCDPLQPRPQGVDGRRRFGSTIRSLAQGIYTPEWTKRTYAECLRRAERALFEGRRVVVDATFREEWAQRAFLDAARRWAVPALLLLCEADPAVARARLEDRRGDASDADWAVHLQAAARWEEPGPSTREAIRTLSTSDGRQQSLAAAVEVLRQEGLDELS